MACHLTRAWDDVGDTILLLINTLSKAETEILRGSPRAPELVELIRQVGPEIQRLEVTFDILSYAKSHGAGPHPTEDLYQALPHDRSLIDQAMDQLLAQGILKTHAPAS